MRCVKNITDSIHAGWSDEPQPLLQTLQSEPYPVDALPRLIRGAVHDVQNFVQAPTALVASSALAALSVATQGLADVRRDSQLTGPSGLFMLTIAESGERKTTVDRFFTDEIRNWEGEQQKLAEVAMRSWEGEKTAWEAKRKGLEARITKLLRDGKGGVEKVQEELSQLIALEPRRPLRPMLLLEDETTEHLCWQLHTEWPSAAILSNEAAVVFGGHAMKADAVASNLGVLNKLWDGQSHRVGRKGAGMFTLEGARLTIGLQVQRDVILDFCERSGAIARGSGWFSRFLVAMPESTMGTRMYREPGEFNGLKSFQRRIRELLDISPSINSGGLSCDSISLTSDAFECWRNFSDEIELQLGVDGKLADLRDSAAKISNNAARLACLFHVISRGPSGLIEKSDFNAARQIVSWHLNEARRLFGELVMPQDQRRACQLDDWLRRVLAEKGVGTITRREVQQSVSPPVLRNGEHLTAAIKVLDGLGRLKLIQDGRQKVIKLHPALIDRAAAA